MQLPLQEFLNSLHASLLPLRDGNVATYIPELAKADPDWFGICLVTSDGYVYAAGDTDQSFTIQSISKPFVYAAALADRGRAAVQPGSARRPTASSSTCIASIARSERCPGIAGDAAASRSTGAGAGLLAYPRPSRARRAAQMRAAVGGERLPLLRGQRSGDGVV